MKFQTLMPPRGRYGYAERAVGTVKTVSLLAMSRVFLILCCVMRALLRNGERCYPMKNDANDWDETERRRAQFSRWLLAAWEWASDSGRPVADKIAELMAHAEEPDYPVWDLARQAGLIGDGKLARLLRGACGLCPDGPVANGWEKAINYAPVVYLDEKTWRQIHGLLGWVNRNYDTGIAAKNFYLWSPAGNLVRFVVRHEIPAATDI